MKRKILSFLRKAYRKILRKRACRVELVKPTGDFFSVSFISSTGGMTQEEILACFRRIFSEAYPIADKFISKLEQLQGYEDAFCMRGSFATTGFVSSMGLSPDYRQWEEETVKKLKLKYPDLKILVYHSPCQDQ